MEGLKECGREWKKVALRIPTRTSAQIRSHAQKYFAKLQRDQDSSTTATTAGGLILATPLVADGKSKNIIVVEGGYISTTIGDAAALSPSIRRNVERIVANPQAAQREVEQTLKALRERYRQLQQRLKDRRRSRQQRREGNEQEGSVEGARPASDASSALPINTNSLDEVQQQHSCRKNMHPPINHDYVCSIDENSSVSSSVSSIAVSRSNEEKIALEVLGDTLPRGDSTNDLNVLATTGCDSNDICSEKDGMISGKNENVSSSSSFVNMFATLPPVANENNPFLAEQGVSLLHNNDDASAAASSSIDVNSTRVDYVATTNIKTKRTSDENTHKDSSSLSSTSTRKERHYQGR